MLAALGWTAVPAMLQAQSGSVTGVVVDASTGLTLAGAAVEIAGTRPAGISNDQGRFLLIGVPAGSHELTVTYLGYATARQRIDVRGGDVTSVRFDLEPQALDIEGVTVVGTRRGQAAALNQQLNAANITQVVASDQIGRFPDANIGDAMKRVPGIVVIQDQGEARFGLIRGTEPRLNSVMVNGERIPSAEAEVREVQLDLIPADMVSAIEVNKALTPDMDADAIGGAVNIVTRSAPVERRISATLGSGYNFLADEPMGIGSGVLAQRFADGRVGLVLSGSYQNHRLGSDNIEAEWADEGSGAFVETFEIREYQIQRLRRSVSAALDAELAPGHVLTWRSLYNHRDDRENRYRLVFGLEEPDASGQAVAELERETKGGIAGGRGDNARLEDQRTYSHSLSGNHLFGPGVALDWSAQIARASEHRPHERYINFVAEDVDVRSDLSDPRKPVLSLVQPVALDAFELDELTDETQFTRDRDTNLRADLTLPVGWGGAELKVGARLRNKSKLRDNGFDEYSPLSGLESLADAERADYTNPGFLPGRYEVGELASGSYLGGLDLENAARFERESVLDEFIPANFEADERIASGYLMLSRPFGRSASVVAGLRVESTDVDYTGYEFVEDDETSRALTGGRSYTNFFPSLHLRWEQSPGRVVRAAWTNTIARPNYYDLVPYRILNREDGELTLGNPDLDPTRSMNLDLLVEQHMGGVGLISAGVFYKAIRDFIFEYTIDDGTDPLTGTVFDELTRPENGAEATLLGFEIAVQRPLFAGFSLYGNYTFTDSSVDGLPIEGRESEELPLPGTSRHTANASLSYDDARLSARASLNFQDDFIDPGELGDEPFFDRYYDRATTVDANAELRVSPTTRIFIEANNLTNQPLRYYQGVRERVMQEEFYDRRFQLGVKVDLR